MEMPRGEVVSGRILASKHSSLNMVCWGTIDSFRE